VLVAGDLLSDVDVPFPWFGRGALAGHPSGLAPYRAGLDRLAGVLARPGLELVVPGHGTPADRRGALARLDLDRRYLDELDRACASAATLEDAQRLAADGAGGRLGDAAVRAGHEASVAALFALSRGERQRSVDRPTSEGERPGGAMGPGGAPPPDLSR
jgi:hypothetical protein